ncbi:MAG: hypothetical protein U9R01_07270, partial [candidate division WOR-3 bacterium]|nr:hypothetical protein [candidate division WOR-3 bacterium]
MKNKIIVIGVLIMLFYSHMVRLSGSAVSSPNCSPKTDSISPFEPYEIAKEKKIEQYSKFVSPFRGEETELFLAR